MEAHLMGRKGSFLTEENTEPDMTAIEDLRLDSVVDAMAGGDGDLRRAAVSALTAPDPDPDDIPYRQAVLKDVLSHPGLIGGMRALIDDTEAERRSSWCWFSGDSVSGMFSSSVALLRIYLPMAGRLRKLLESTGGLSSEGLTGLRDMLAERFPDSCLGEAEGLLKELAEERTLLVSAGIGGALLPDGFLALERTQGRGMPGLLSPSFTVPERDDAGHDDLRLIREKALAPSARVLAGAARGLEEFFSALSRETAFYAGAERLYGRLVGAGAPVCFPETLGRGERRRSWKGLVDPSLVLSGIRATGCDMDDTHAGGFIVTGANGGGKTTFLRSIGCAQMMMQAGLFVTAECFTAPLRSPVMTHFVSGESGERAEGRLAAELVHMRSVTDKLGEGGLLLTNEAFSSTDDRDGSIIALGIFRALLERGTDIFSVTHLLGFAEKAQGEDCETLMAERLPDGTRTHRIVRGRPEGTAHGLDIWRRVFGSDGEPL